MVSPSTSFLSVSGMDTSGETVGRKGKESFFNYLKKLYLNRVMIYDLLFDYIVQGSYYENSNVVKNWKELLVHVILT